MSPCRHGATRVYPCYLPEQMPALVMWMLVASPLHQVGCWCVSDLAAQLPAAHQCSEKEGGEPAAKHLVSTFLDVGQRDSEPFLWLLWLLLLLLMLQHISDNLIFHLCMHRQCELYMVSRRQYIPNLITAQPEPFCNSMCHMFIYAQMM